MDQGCLPTPNCLPNPWAASGRLVVATVLLDLFNGFLAALLGLTMRNRASTATNDMTLILSNTFRNTTPVLRLSVML